MLSLVKSQDARKAMIVESAPIWGVKIFCQGGEGKKSENGRERDASSAYPRLIC